MPVQSRREPAETHWLFQPCLSKKKKKKKVPHDPPARCRQPPTRYAQTLPGKRRKNPTPASGNITVNPPIGGLICTHTMPRALPMAAEPNMIGLRGLCPSPQWSCAPRSRHLGWPVGYLPPRVRCRRIQKRPHAKASNTRTHTAPPHVAVAKIRRPTRELTEAIRTSLGAVYHPWDSVVETATVAADALVDEPGCALPIDGLRNQSPSHRGEQFSIWNAPTARPATASACADGKHQSGERSG